MTADHVTQQAATDSGLVWRQRAEHLEAQLGAFQRAVASETLAEMERLLLLQGVAEAAENVVRMFEEDEMSNEEADHYRLTDLRLALDRLGNR